MSGEGWLGRRGGVDLAVLMNPQTWNRDIAEVEGGGYMLYDVGQGRLRVRSCVVM